MTIILNHTLSHTLQNHSTYFCSTCS